MQSFYERHFTALLLAILLVISLAVTIWLMVAHAIDRTDIAWAQGFTGGISSGLLLALNATRAEKPTTGTDPK